MAAVPQDEADVRRQVKSEIEAILRMRPNQLEMASTFESFGVDSIVVMELISKLSAKFGVKITPATGGPGSNRRRIRVGMNRDQRPSKTQPPRRLSDASRMPLCIQAACARASNWADSGRMHSWNL